MHGILFLFIPLLAGVFYAVNEPSATIYETPKNNSHIEDILRYGTKVKVSKEKNEWAYVNYPGWQGWILKAKLIEINDSSETQTKAVVGYRGAYVFKINDTEWGPFLYLPFETPLNVIEEFAEAYERWVLIKLLDGQTGYVQRSHLVFSPKLLNMDEMVKFSQQFLNTNYLWGGTTSFGYDCSGFIQMLYRQIGVSLPRNSNQQATDSRLVEVKREEGQAGDLAFFKNKSGTVVHVALMISSHEFIHSFTKEEAWICISSLTDERWDNGHFYYGIEMKRLQL